MNRFHVTFIFNYGHFKGKFSTYLMGENEDKIRIDYSTKEFCFLDEKFIPSYLIIDKVK